MLKIIKKINILILFTLVMSCSHTKEAHIYEGYAPVTEGKIYYQVYGKGEPMIVLHGGPGLDHNYLLPEMAKLANHTQVVFYDQRGSGKSTSTSLDAELINIDRFVEDLEQLRMHLGYNKFILTGHSWGGLLALNYAIKYPKRISSLILLNTAPATYKGCQVFHAEYAKRATGIQEKLKNIQKSAEFAEGEPKTIANFFRTIFSVYVYQKGDEDKLNLNFSPQEALNGIKVNTIFNKSFFNCKYDYKNELQKLNIPTLIVHGRQDPVPLWAAQEIRKLIPSSQLFIIDKCGHFPYIEQPREFFNIIEGFLNK